MIWVVALNSSIFDSFGISWLNYAKNFPNISLHVADAGLHTHQKKLLQEHKVNLISVQSNSHFDVWTALLNANLSDGTILYTTEHLKDPLEVIQRGKDRMVFLSLSDPEYYFLCKPIVSITSQAMTANYVEKSMNLVASPVVVCGPAYWWKTMIGLTNAMRNSQPFYNGEGWEFLCVNLFAAAYPESIFLI